MFKDKFLSEISSPFEARLKAFIRQKVDNENDAEDIFQETLVAASQSLPTFKGKSSFFTWLCGIANHEIADFYRKKKIKTFLFSRFPFLETLVSEALGPEEELLKQELRKEVKQVLSRISEGYSLVLRLKYYQGLSMAEIAEKLGMTVKAVESKLSRAREAFRVQWNAQYKK
ncbi:MAG TPA: sigma-70 family RNA polymerase sigma factor [Patescibacteria group bacterium]|nr:sigma-70 family RNA polymerase sigma factor [Patescibacteria group bacterium]